MELFELLHKGPVMVDPITERMFLLQMEKVPFLVHQLQLAELSKREGKAHGFFQCMSDLADYFESEGDVDTSQKFLEKARAHAQRSGDRELEGEIEESLGMFFERIGKIQEALASYEVSARIGSQIGNRLAAQKAMEHLMSVYRLLAEKAEE